jgi:hypothetical protein
MRRNSANCSKLTRIAASSGGIACSTGAVGTQPSVSSLQTTPQRPACLPRLKQQGKTAVAGVRSMAWPAPMRWPRARKTGRAGQARLVCQASCACSGQTRAVAGSTCSLSRYWSTCLRRAHDTTDAAKSRPPMVPCMGTGTQPRSLDNGRQRCPSQGPHAHLQRLCLLPAQTEFPTNPAYAAVPTGTGFPLPPIPTLFCQS